MYRPYSRAMKYSFSVSLLLVFLFMAACTPGRERFTVHGNISDPLASEPGSMVYLSGPEGPMDSVAVKNGKFVLYGDKDRTKLLVVSLRFKGRDALDDRFTASFVPDSDTIGVDLDYPVAVTGSPLTDAIHAFREQVMDYYYEHDPALGDIETGENEEQTIADSLYKLRMDRIISLSKDTYLANTDNALGMQALSLLLSELGREELEELVAQGGEFIRNDSHIKKIIESK